MNETDQPKSLGQFLKSERERRGLSLDQVSSVTKIGVRVLQALEADRYSDMPALPFVRGFIKTYCKLLQLDQKQVLQDYDEFLKEKSKSRPNREGGMSGYAFERPEGEQAKKFLWMTMGTAFVFGVLVVLIFKPSLKHRKHGSVAKLTASASPSPSASPSTSSTEVAVAASPGPSSSPTPFVAPATPLVLALPSPSPSPSAVAVALLPSPSPSLALVSSPSPSPSPSVVAALPSPAPSPSPSVVADTTQQDPLQTGIEYAPQDIKYKVVVRALADVWVRYQCDDKKPMRFILRSGRILVLRGKALVRFQASNTASVNLSALGRTYRPMATHPQVFQYLDTATLIWPQQARDGISQNFEARGSLPVTPAPEPVPTPSVEAPTSEDSASIDSSSDPVSEI